MTKRTIGGLGAALLVALCAAWAAPARALPQSVILFTADTANDLDPGGTTLGVPADSNGGHLPAISAGVTLSVGGIPVVEAPLQGDIVGPLNDNTYGPVGFLGEVAGSTGWVTTSFTFAQSGRGRLFWEVANVLDFSFDSVLGIDNVLLTNTLGDTVFHFGFESGLPAGFRSRGVAATSPAVPGLAPTEGNLFAFLDTIVPMAGPTAPRFDTDDGVHAAQLMSPFMFFNAGDTLSMDLVFVTSDGGSEFHDYAVVAVVPEPGSLVLLMSGLLGLGCARRGRRRQHAGAPPRPA